VVREGEVRGRMVGGGRWISERVREEREDQ